MDKYEKEMYFFNAMPLNQLKDRCHSYGHVIIDHLVRCYIFPNSGYVSHWIDEIDTWLSDLATSSVKSGSFKYQYVFEDFQPLTQRNTTAFINRAESRESELSPESYDSWRSVAQYLNKVIDQIERLQGKSSRVLTTKEISTIIINNLRDSNRLKSLS